MEERENDEWKTIKKDIKTINTYVVISHGYQIDK